MGSMDQMRRIRNLYYGAGKSLTDIAGIEGIGWQTVRKYVDTEKFNEAPSIPEEELYSSKLDSFKLIIDNWLTKASRNNATRLRESTGGLKMRYGYDFSHRLVAA